VFYGVVLGAPLISTAQTNSVHPDMRWFVLPTPQLRILSTESAKSVTDHQKVSLAPLSATSNTTAPKSRLPSSFSADTGSEDTDIDPRYRNFVLTKLPDLESQNWVDRGFEPVFSPGEFRIGRTAKVSCVITTAIKRKDPLCLLNPSCFFHLSW
jgi:hypothetical protein